MTGELGDESLRGVLWSVPTNFLVAVSVGAYHVLHPRTERESSGKVPGVLDGRRALADEPERRAPALPDEGRG